MYIGKLLQNLKPYVDTISVKIPKQRPLVFAQILTVILRVDPLLSPPFVPFYMVKNIVGYRFNIFHHATAVKITCCLKR